MDDRSDHDWEAWLEEKIRRLVDELTEFVRKGGAAPDHGSHVPDPPAEHSDDQHPSGGTGTGVVSRRAKTSQVVHRVTIVWGPSEWLAQIDNHRKPVHLGRGNRLRSLLQALASKRGNHDRDDGLVPAKSNGVLAELVYRITRDRIRKLQTVRVHVMRLRTFFQIAGLHPGLIETLGDCYRLRLADDGQVTVNGETVA